MAAAGGFGSSRKSFGISTTGNFGSGVTAGGSVFFAGAGGETAASLVPAGRDGSAAGGALGGVVAGRVVPGLDTPRPDGRVEGTTRGTGSTLGGGRTYTGAGGQAGGAAYTGGGEYTGAG